MNVIICEDYTELSKIAATLTAEQINRNPKSVLGLATGSTPIGMYGVLAEMYKSGEVDFADVTSFNLDEYYPLPDDNPQSYHHFMDENLFSRVNINKANTHILNGMCDDTDKECERFEAMIRDSGGIDLQILGIGQNGHIGFNEPDSSLNSRTHLTHLTENTISANSRFFNDISEVPTMALTMGMGTILRAKKILLLASGENKRHAVSALLNDDITTANPASMLKVHHCTTLICDRRAYPDK